MKKIVLFIASIILLIPFLAQSQSINYYLPDSITYDPRIPRPEEVIGHEVGKWHVTHDKLLLYMRTLAQISDRIEIEEHGKSYEDRPIVLLKISSPKNLANLPKIQEEHLQLSDPDQSAKLDISKMPVVIWQGYSIHGNEPSGSNASMLYAYFLAAAQGEKINQILDQSLILLDPSFNPDGLNRFATWVNMHKSYNLVTDPQNRELREVWPGSRTNHYWFDLNRDWLPVQHNESQARVLKFQAWKPNILTDHHEMGSNSTFFFQPGVPSRVNPLTPKQNQVLTEKIGTFHAKHLDKIGSLYYTQEDYDDFYYGKGSTYPDVNGGIGILFEQASSRGHAQETENGILRFPFTIRNQVVTSLSTLEAASEMRTELLDYQRNFYKNALTEVQKEAVKGFVFSEKKDVSRLTHFLEMLSYHNIRIYKLKNTISAEGKTFEKENSYAVPLNQPQAQLIKAFFQQETQFKDSIFYDISAWTMPLAFNLTWAKLQTINDLGSPMESYDFPQGRLMGESNYAYLLEWNDYYAPKALNFLQGKGLITKTATAPFEAELVGEGKRQMEAGTIMIAVQNQALSPEKVGEAVRQAAMRAGVTIRAVRTGLTPQGSDLGSSNFSKLDRPKVMMVVGEGVDSNDAGEIWHLLDQRFEMPLAMYEQERLESANLDRYNRIIMVEGSYERISSGAKENLRDWVQRGGTLILFKKAITWAKNQKLINVNIKNANKKDTTTVISYAEKGNVARSKEIGGAILEAQIDLTHPLFFGYQNATMPIFKDNDLAMERENSTFNSPLVFTKDPLLSGYLPFGTKNDKFENSKTSFNKARTKDQFAHSAVINLVGLGRGKVICSTENLNFRAFWFGTNRILLNALFLAEAIETR